MTDDATRVSDTDDTIPAESEPAGAAAIPAAQRYRLGVELGRGGMGRVVEAFDTQLGRTVALKEVLATREGIDRRFAREVQITARLEHPAIVPLYDSGTTADGRPFYVMRKVTGRPLDEVIARSANIDERLGQLPAVLAAIDAVGHAHRRGVIHRDLKPANILVGELGETVVIDWGLAKVIGEDDEAVEAMASDSLHTQIGSVFGTPGFMAPEQARGEELGTRGDVYALGATLYQLLAGKPPHRGKSATEVLSSTLSNAKVPFAVELVGAPPDLVAIVVKALAFEAADRYPDAVALGEDVRRFLAGQLVAAHRYTRRQRLARFAKRHRGVLAVAAIATTCVAALAWYGVHRILDERDLADAARGEALAESHTAHERLIAVQDRDERRTVANARALVESNPTAAIATLKLLPPASKYVDEARTVAQAAVARGVVWGHSATTAMTFQAQLSPSGDRLFQLTNDGWARLWDLRTHRLAWQQRAPDLHARMTWVGDSKHLIVRHETAPPELVDVVAMSAVPLPIASMRAVVAATHGDRIVYADAAGTLHRFEVNTRTDLALPVTLDKREELAIAPDGAHFAISDSAKRVTVYDDAGREIAHRDGAFYAVAFSETGRVAAFGAPDVAELELATGAWTAVPLPALPKYTVSQGGYLDDDLVFESGPHVYTWRTSLTERFSLGTMYGGGFVLAGDLVIAELTEARLRYASHREVGEIPLPTTVTNLRLIGQPKLQRLIVVGEGLLLDLPLDTFVSHPIPKPRDETPWFVGDDALLYLPSGGDSVRWLELGTRKETTISLGKPGVPSLMSIDPRGGRALISSMYGSVNGAQLDQAPTRLYVVTRDRARLVAETPGLWGVLTEGDGLVYSDAAGKLYGAIGDAAPRELAALEGRVASLARRDKRGYAAYTDKGELVRGWLDRPQLDKIFIRKTAGVELATDAAHRVYVGQGTRLSRWDTDVQELHDFGKPIESLTSGAGGLVVGLDGGEFFLWPVDPPGPAKRLLSVGARDVGTGDDGRVLIALGQSGALQIIELPSRIMWSIPASISTSGRVTISPTARTVLYEPDLGSTYSMLHTLVAGPTDLAAWLDELTNATVDESGLIVWPWQAP